MSILTPFFQKAIDPKDWLRPQNCTQDNKTKPNQINPQKTKEKPAHSNTQ